MKKKALYVLVAIAWIALSIAWFPRNSSAQYTPPRSGAQGGSVLLESHAASNSATLVFSSRNAAGQSGATFQSDFDNYVLHVVSLAPASNAQNINLQFSADGGSTYDTSNVYQWGTFDASGAGSGVASGGTTAAPTNAIDFWHNQANTSNWSANGVYNIWNPLGSTFKFTTGQSALLSSGGSRIEMQMHSGIYGATSTVNAFKLFYSAGNISSGTVYVFGVAKN